ncbi:MAG: nuclear transport factor 2 family protein [Kamptonema sp. SIO4C4]|nr:nuclear transport factor 2 family protein [Kamptonema sp. SIO4C4]
MLPATELRTLIKIAADACQTKNAKAFASLFTATGELIIPGYRFVGKEEIEQVTHSYLGACESVTITIQRIIVEGNQAVVEWVWSSVEKETGKQTYAENAIVVNFKAGAIARWREYSDKKTVNRKP